MEARELRIGNYVLCRGAFARVTSISEDGIGYVKQSGIGEGKIPLKLVKPITLTEEWLLKFGFEVNEFHKNYKIKVDYYHHSIKFYENEWVYSNDISDASCHTIASVNYVHQLQNIYFALTNEELTIKND
jgi:hypothetical protein